MILTNTDITAIANNDSNYICMKGANLYMNKEYKEAIEYYHLASAMGSVNATSNLGYCYLYGRDIEPNIDLAISYFKIAAGRGNVEACYKLGDIYGNEKWNLKDPEMSVYYYRLAISFILGDEWNESYSIAYCDELKKYPSLCFAMGREMLPNGHMATDIQSAYLFLKQAESGYLIELQNGADFYEKTYSSVVELLSNEIFDVVRIECDKRLDSYESQ